MPYSTAFVHYRILLRIATSAFLSWESWWVVYVESHYALTGLAGIFGGMAANEIFNNIKIRTEE